MTDLAILVSHISNLAGLSKETVASYCAALSRTRHINWKALHSIAEACRACGISRAEGLGIHAAFFALHYGPSIFTNKRASFFHFYDKYTPPQTPNFNPKAVKLGDPVQHNKLRELLIYSRQHKPVFYGEIARQCQTLCELPAQVVSVYFEKLCANRPPFLFSDISKKAGISQAAGLGIQLAFFIGWFGLKLITHPLSEYCTVYEKNCEPRPIQMHRTKKAEEGPTTLYQVMVTYGDGEVAACMESLAREKEAQGPEAIQAVIQETDLAAVNTGGCGEAAIPQSEDLPEPNAAISAREDIEGDFVVAPAISAGLSALEVPHE